MTPQEAKPILGSLAQGMQPKSGEIIENACVLDSPAVIRAVGEIAARRVKPGKITELSDSYVRELELTGPELTHPRSARGIHGTLD